MRACTDGAGHVERAAHGFGKAAGQHEAEAEAGAALPSGVGARSIE